MERERGASTVFLRRRFGSSVARLGKAHHDRVGFRLAPDCARVRLFKTPREAFWGATQNILVAVGGRRWRAMPLVLLGVAPLGTPLLALALGVVNADGGLLLAGLTTYGTQYLGFFTLRRLVRFRPGPLLFFPLAAIVAACYRTRALCYSTKGVIFWRGRKIRVRGGIQVRVKAHRRTSCSTPHGGRR